MNVYDNGDLVRCTGTFTTAAGVVQNPAAVLCKYMTPAGTTTTLTYGVDAALVRASTGIYYVDVNANASGIWKYRFYSTGNGQAAGESSFRVRVSEF